jgi:photosynthetic reaction center cytochrome c subunit
MADVYKNIKVLHGAASRLDPLMKEFNTALGVGCTYCHVQDEWEKDIPMKEKARRMVELSNAANERQPEREVTCWTCHRGHAVPENVSIEPPPAKH